MSELCEFSKSVVLVWKVKEIQYKDREWEKEEKVIKISDRGMQVFDYWDLKFSFVMRDSPYYHTVNPGYDELFLFFTVRK